MIRTPFAVYRQIRLAVGWYGTDYEFSRSELNQYGEPEDELEPIQTVSGIYHSSERSFIELINNEGASVKSKVSKGILCDADNDLAIRQGDRVTINGVNYHVTTVEPVLYSEEVVAYEISIEEEIEVGDVE